MKTTEWIPFKQKTGLIILIVTVALLQSSVSTPSLKTLGVGMDAPDLAVQDFSGKAQKLSSLKGDKLTLLIFWATWSKNSEKALKQMEKIHTKYKDQGLSVLGINVERQNIDGKTLTAIKRVADELNLSYPLLVDQGLVTFNDYGVIAVPTVVILEKDRKIRYEMSGWAPTGIREMSHILAADIEGIAAPAEGVAKTGYHPDKKAVRSWNMGVKALKSKRMAQSAEKWFKKAISADPKFILPYISLGTYYKNEGELAAAKEYFEKAVMLDPDNSIALGDLALLLIEEGESTIARQHLEKAIMIDEAYSLGYYYLGYLTGKEGNMKKAAELFTRAEEINPLDYRIQVYRGKMFEDQKDLPQAVKSYKKALQQILNLQ